MSGHVQTRCEQPPWGSGIRAVAGSKKGGASYNLWLHPLTEHATKDGQAVSTPFWPTGFVHEYTRSKPGLLFITRQSEVKVRHPGTIKAMGEIFGAHSRKTEITAIPGHLKTFGEHGESPSHKSLGSPGPTVFGRGQRANDVPRSKRVTETNVKRHKEQSGTGGSQFHSKRPNKAKAALEAPSRLNVRSYDGWRY
ncbi:hypothetical protein CRG98_018556 [Punica granatum]|uniref:Uncharacterized protein n=1 Tax=Punica granatum TaxID=22663 RepID=A0A2I0JXL4_PUNGR|nr:hypothetical protein CRG98_018556 [Punica granatum]